VRVEFVICAGLLGIIFQNVPELDYSSIYRNRLDEYERHLPNYGYIDEMIVLRSDNYSSIVQTSDGKQYVLNTKLPPKSRWRGVQVRNRVVVKKDYVSGATKVCAEHLSIDWRSGVVKVGSIYVSTPDGKMTGWASVINCKKN